jgi:hypothetical protein
MLFICIPIEIWYRVIVKGAPRPFLDILQGENGLAARQAGPAVARRKAQRRGPAFRRIQAWRASPLAPFVLWVPFVLFFKTGEGVFRRQNSPQETRQYTLKHGQTRPNTLCAFFAEKASNRTKTSDRPLFALTLAFSLRV